MDPSRLSQGLLHSEFREHVGDSGRKPNAAHSRHSSKCVAEEKEQSEGRATNAAADHCSCSGSYIQDIRNALANLILEVQSRSLDSIGHYENAVLEILLDETELKISQRKVIQCFWRKRKQRKVVHVNTVVPALAVHGSNKFCGGNIAFLQDIVVPMIGMEAKTGSCMLNVLKRELEPLVKIMKKNAPGLVLSCRVTPRLPTKNISDGGASV